VNQITQIALIQNRVISILETLDTPTNVLDLFDVPEMQEVCPDRGKLSQVLSDLWRSGQLTRVPCVVPGSQVKYAYEVAKGGKMSKPRTESTSAPHVKVRPQMEAHQAKSKPRITVTEHLVTIELDSIYITVEV
jgi:hypothetical protein